MANSTYLGTDTVRIKRIPWNYSWRKHGTCLEHFSKSLKVDGVSLNHPQAMDDALQAVMQGMREQFLLLLTERG